MADLTPEQIAEIASKAAIAAVSAAMGGAQAPSSVEPAAAEEDASEADAIRQSAEDARIKTERIDALVKELIPLIMQPRHLEVFSWAAGDQWAAYVSAIIRAEVQRQTPDYRESRGGGGSSSRNIEALSERLMPRK